MSKRQPKAAMLIGKPTGRYKASTIVLLTRKHRSKWWELVCFGQKGHYRRADGGCAHTDEMLVSVRLDIRDRVKVLPFGGKD